MHPKFLHLRWLWLVVINGIVRSPVILHDSLAHGMGFRQKIFLSYCVDSTIIYQLFALLYWVSKTILNTLWAFKQKAFLDCILSLTKKLNGKCNVTNKLLGDTKQPWKSMDLFKSTFETSCATHHSNSRFD